MCTKLALFVRILFQYLLPASCDDHNGANYASFNMNFHADSWVVTSCILVVFVKDSETLILVYNRKMEAAYFFETQLTY